MIVIDDKIISDAVIEDAFVCDLSKCKGACCEDGDAGAPLLVAEKKEVKKYYPVIKKYLTKQSIDYIEQNGLYTFDNEFGWVTPTMHADKGICAYAIREKDGMIKCAFEQAYNNGEIRWKKPISCHLYPIISYKGKHGDYERLNYEPRKLLCAPACALGQKLKVPVYKFLKEPLIRKYGSEFYDVLDQIANRDISSAEEQ